MQPARFKNFKNLSIVALPVAANLLGSCSRWEAFMGEREDGRWMEAKGQRVVGQSVHHSGETIVTRMRDIKNVKAIPWHKPDTKPIEILPFGSDQPGVQST